MTYDDIIKLLASALQEKAKSIGCLAVLDGFNQRPDDEVQIVAPISNDMLTQTLESQQWPDECQALLKKSKAATLGELMCFLSGKEIADAPEEEKAALFSSIIKFCYDFMADDEKLLFWQSILECNSLIKEVSE